MAPSASTKVEKGISRTALNQQSTDEPRSGYRYYESDKVLGELFRAIDEDLFFQDLEDDVSSLFSLDATNNVLTEILSWDRPHVNRRHQELHMTHAREIRDYYEGLLLSFMSLYAIRRTEVLTEKEVFLGTIMGRSSSTSKSQREWSDEMKTRFNRELRDIKLWMQDRILEDEDDIVNMAAACLHVAVKEKSEIAKQNDLKSFGWFAAGMCVPDLVRGEEGSVFSI